MRISRILGRTPGARPGVGEVFVDYADGRHVRITVAVAADDPDMAQVRISTAPPGAPMPRLRILVDDGVEAEVDWRIKT